MGTYSYPNLKVVLRRYYLGENYLWQGDWGFPPTSGRLVYQMPCLLARTVRGVCGQSGMVAEDEKNRMPSPQQGHPTILKLAID